MFSLAQRHAVHGAAFSATQSRGFKVAVLGAAGGIGQVGIILICIETIFHLLTCFFQPLSLLLKLNPRVTELTCYDVSPVTPGIFGSLSFVEVPVF